MWGVDAQSGEFVAYCFDNFQGHRMFEDNRALAKVTGEEERVEAAPTKSWWKDGKLVLSHHAIHPKVGSYFEHFIYQRTGEHSFKMTYETSLDGINWQMGDWLMFKKVEG
jgi:hypothetical protein